MPSKNWYAASFLISGLSPAVICLQVNKDKGITDGKR